MSHEAKGSRIGDSADDSDFEFMNEQPTGNIHKIAIVPPNYTGKPRKGHLIFDACYECGNLGRVDYISDFEYDLFIRPDTCNSRFRIWFNFTVENVKQDQRVIFNVVNFSKSKSLYREGMSPLVKSTSRSKWQRIPAKNVYYYRCPEHKKNYVMSFVFCFDVEDDVYQFAYAFPYSYTKLQNYLQILDNRHLDYYERELLAMSVQQRRLDLLTISDPELRKASDKKRKIVTITARVHPGETPSSYVCQGLIEFLVSSHPVAKVLRKNIVFKIIPMLNPDGVYLGNYRCSLMGFDLNRVWQDPSPWAHPELFAAKSQVMSFDKDPNTDLDFFIDIHAHSTMMNGFMYGNIYEDSNRYERQAIFPKLLCSNADDFSMNSTSFNKDAVKAGTGRRTLGGSLDENCYCYTLEVSFFSYQPAGFTHPIPYTEEEYMKLGRNLARTFLDYYKLQNHIIFNPSNALTNKLNNNATYVNMKMQANATLSSSHSTNTIHSGNSNGSANNNNNNSNNHHHHMSNGDHHSQVGSQQSMLNTSPTSNGHILGGASSQPGGGPAVGSNTSMSSSSSANIYPVLNPIASRRDSKRSPTSLSSQQQQQQQQPTQLKPISPLNSLATAHNNHSNSSMSNLSVTMASASVVSSPPDIFGHTHQHNSTNNISGINNTNAGQASGNNSGASSRNTTPPTTSATPINNVSPTSTITAATIASMSAAVATIASIGSNTLAASPSLDKQPTFYIDNASDD